MTNIPNFKRLLMMIVLIVGTIALFSDIYAKVTLFSNPLSDPDTIIVKFDKSSDFENFREGLENVGKVLLRQKEEFGDEKQTKFYNQWLFDLNIVFDKNLGLSLQGNDYVSKFKLYDIFARIILSDFNVVENRVSANYAKICARFNDHIYKYFEQVPSAGAGIIFHTDFPSTSGKTEDARGW